jgi:hypothetical protein
MSSTCLALEFLDGRLLRISMASAGFGMGWLTDTGNHDDVTILSFSHDGKHGFDDVHVGEKVDLEDLVD